jgi:hypothetical protein
MSAVRGESDTSWNAPVWIEPLAAGEMIEVYFWTQRAWRSGCYLIDPLGRAIVAIPGRAPLRFEAAQLMGLRRLIH